MQAESLEGYRLSPQQRHLWRLLRRGGNGPYQTKCAVEVKGRLESRCLKTAAEKIIARHEILRTTFHCLPGMTIPTQVINETGGLAWREDDISSLGGEASLIEAFFETDSPPFDFEQGPFLSLHLIKKATNDFVIIIRLPAICADAVSMRNLVAELCQDYAAPVCSEALDRDVMQYADLAEWQNDLIESEETQAAGEYWRQRALPRPPIPQLAFEGFSAGGGTFEPRFDGHALAPHLTARIESLARNMGRSVEQILLATWQILLWRHTGKSEIEVGTLFDGRRAEEIEGALGLFAKYLPITCQLEEELAFSDLIEQIELSVQSARNWQEYFSWERLVQESAESERRPSFLPFCFEAETPQKIFSAGDVSFAIFRQLACIDRFKIKLTYLRKSDDLTIGFHYDSELFRSEDIQCLTGQFLALLESVLARPVAGIGELEMISEAERRRLLSEYNSTKVEWPKNRTVHELFEEQRGRTPETIAVIYEDQRLSYRELNERADKLAHYLRGLGVGPEVIVGICMERSIDLAVSLLAVLKAGGAYLPLDASYPLSRISFMLKDAAAGALLTQTRLRSRFSSIESPRIECVDALWENLPQAPERDCETTLSPDNLAYVIYTSGSTGGPKGVMLRHMALTNYLLWATDHYHLSVGCGAPVHSSLGFDLTITALFPPLLVGGHVHMLSTESEVEALGAAFSERPGYSLVKLTPAHLQLLAERLGEASLDGAAHSLVIGGENLRAQAVSRWRERAPAIRLFNEYGPTESVVGCVVYEVGDKAEVEKGRVSVPIGRPIANTRLYLLDERQKPAAYGVVGELHIGGEGLARGYLNQPDLTAERFVPDPYSGEPGVRLYRTGDLARYLRDGQLECLGRVDHQVKVRGYRIEPGEIESVLRTLPLVREAVVTVISEDGQSRLIGFVVGDGEQQPDAARSRRYLQERLPEHMIPAELIALKALPITANGKIDRKKLLAMPLPKNAGRQTEQEYISARTPVEEMLVGIFEELLKQDRVGIYDSFFEIGGHSLLATQIISRVRNSFGVEIGVRSLFDEPTVEGLARRIEEVMRAGEKDRTPPLVRVPRGGKLPLSFAQQRLWFLDQLVPNNPLYNIPGAARLEGRLDLEVLESVINTIIRRHEVLRTRIEVEAGEPIQIIEEWERQRLWVEDLTGLTEKEREERVRVRTREEAETGFDLRRGPMVRVKVLKLEDQQHLVLFTMHHIVSDGWSMGVLVREVCMLYEAMSQGGGSPLPELDIQYADYAAWQRRYLRGEALEEHLQYWKKQFSGRPPVSDLPGDYPRPLIPSYRGAIKSFSLPAELYESLKALSRREGVTLFMVLLAAFKTILYKYTERSDLVIGVPNANRNRAEIESLIGFFVNILPMRTDLSGNPRFRELLWRVKDVALGAYVHQDLPFEKLVEEIQPERGLNQAPLFNIAFGIQNAPKAEGRLTQLKISPVAIEQESARFDLTLWVVEGATAMGAEWIYSTDLFKEETIRRIHCHFETLLSNVIAQPDARLDELEMLSETERARQAANRSMREEYNYSKFKSVKPKAITLSSD